MTVPATGAFEEPRVRLVCEHSCRISAVCSVLGGAAYIGTADGQLQAWDLPAMGGAPHFRAQWQLSSTRHAVLQLQPLPEHGLLLCLHAGAVTAHALDSLRLIIRLHHSRTTTFHSDAATPQANPPLLLFQAWK